MKIAQVSPLFESVPPKTYGGTERVVHYLTEELVRQGHQVTLYASGDSRTSADLRPIVPEALRLARDCMITPAWHMLQLNAVAGDAADYDIVHFHTDFHHFPLWRFMATPQVTTLHGRLDLPDLVRVYDEFQDMQVVSISNAQRLPLPRASWAGTVYNGIPVDCYDFREQPGEYLVFLGRISPEKGIEDAIDIALATGMPLKIAAKVDPADRTYFQERIRGRLEHPLLEYVGEVDEQAKNDLLGGARAVLMPIAWPEPFGLVMVEAMACGTPVIAYDRGAVPEVMRDGVCGYMVEGIDGAVKAVRMIDGIDRAACRRHVEDHFSARRMAAGYLKVYTALTEPKQGVREAVG